jgi:hypothetical protein
VHKRNPVLRDHTLVRIRVPRIRVSVLLSSKLQEGRIPQVPAGDIMVTEKVRGDSTSVARRSDVGRQHR